MTNKKTDKIHLYGDQTRSTKYKVTNKAHDAMSEIRSQVGDLRITLEIIGRDKAFEYLSLNNDNRRVNRRRVATISRQIDRGSWTFNGATIVIATDEFGHDERLLDGQHRLYGLFESETAPDLAFIVVRGIAKEAFGFIDIGQSRSLADTLYINGTKKRENQLSSALKYYFCLKKGLSLAGFGGASSGPASLTNDELIQFHKENPVVEKSLDFISSMNNKPFISVGMCAAIHAHMVSIDEELANDYMKKVIDGIGLVSESVEQAVRDRLVRDGNGPASRSTQYDRAEIMILGWNRIRSGNNTPLKRIRTRRQRRNMQDRDMKKNRGSNQPTFPKIR